jgi:hypothetical protein
LKAPRRTHSANRPHQQPEIECGDVNQQSLQDVVMSAQVRSTHATGFIQVSVDALQSLTALANWMMRADSPV